MDIGASFNLTVNLSDTKIKSITDIASICCPICSKPFTSRYRNINCFHVLCRDCMENSTNCKICNALKTTVDILHPNEELFLCPKDNCRRGFINFSSVSYHVQLYHSEEDWIGTEVVDIMPKFNYNLPVVKPVDSTKDKQRSTSNSYYSPIIEDNTKDIKSTSKISIKQSTSNMALDTGLDIEDLENLM